MRLRVRRLASSVGIEIAAGVVVACLALAGGLVWAVLFRCAGDLPNRVAQGELLLMHGGLTSAEPIVLDAVKQAPECECVKQLATEYYRLVMIDAIRKNQLEKAAGARQSCISYAAKWEFFIPISARRKAAGAYCDTALTLAWAGNHTSERPRDKQSVHPKPKPAPAAPEETLPEALEKQGLADGEILALPDPERLPKAHDGQVMPAGATRGNPDPALFESEREAANCRRAPGKVKETGSVECPKAEQTAAPVRSSPRPEVGKAQAISRPARSGRPS